MVFFLVSISDNEVKYSQAIKFNKVLHFVAWKRSHREELAKGCPWRDYTIHRTRPKAEDLEFFSLG
ncbi:STAS domain-containing protein [Psidium guajava]|nr:STAS domain-containing protein [Psidium guajava]